VTSPGEVLNGRYRLTERLGAGAMGSVWKAFDSDLERTVAVKELVPERYDVEDQQIRRERARREALALAKVEHPAVVSIHDLIYVGQTKDPWIVMAYVSGRSLDKMIRESPELEEHRVAAIGLAVLQGLVACHERGVYHRDVKPANIVLAEDSSVRLVDFGIARILGQRALTEKSKILGTPEYLAPELLNEQQASPSSDLWALGVTLYAALEGRSPFRAETLSATIAAILNRNPPEPRSRGPLAALVLQMLRKRPAARPEAATVAAVLRSVASTGAPDNRPYWLGPDRTAERPVVSPVSQERGDEGWRPPAQRPENPRRPAEPQQVRPSQRLTPLAGMPALNAAKIIAGWSTDHAVVDLLALDETESAKIVNRCADPVAGKLLSAIAATQPGRARKILEMVTVDRAGRLLDHMSSAAAAATLALPQAAGAVRILARADNTTIVGAFAEMSHPAAARLIETMDTGRAVELLSQGAPVTVAGILRNVAPRDEGQALLSRLPSPLRDQVAGHWRKMSTSGSVPIVRRIV
jgi:serine/threonine protein kinase